MENDSSRWLFIFPPTECGIMYCKERGDIARCSARMKLVKYVPRSRLRECVELFWLRDNSEPAHQEKREAILPDGRPHLVINLSEDAVRVFPRVLDASCETLDGSVFCGAHSSPYAILPTASIVMGVHFRAGGAYPLFPMPQEELRELRIPLSKLYGSAAGELREQLLEAASTSARFDLLENFLLGRMQRPPVLHRAVAHALLSFRRAEATSVNDLLQVTGLSRRYFSRVFREQVGLTPKLFQRVQRFQRITNACATRREIDWTMTALEAGYYDQAHFIHDFRTFSSVTPSEFLVARMTQRNHLRIAA